MFRSALELRSTELVNVSGVSLVFKMMVDEIKK